MEKMRKNGVRNIVSWILATALVMSAMLPISHVSIQSAMAEDIETVKITALQSNVTDLGLEGYVGENVKGNVENWQIGAYEANKGIVDRIALSCQGEISLDSVLGQDWFGVDGYYDIDVAESYDELSEKYVGAALCYKPKKADAYRGDAGFRLDHGTYSGITDWTGTREIWVFVDASAYGADVYIRINFEEGEPNSPQWEAYSPVQGKAGRLISNGGETPVTYTFYEQYGDAFFKIEKGFKGFLAIPFDNEHFWRYASDGGNGKIDGVNVRQMTIAVGGATEQAVGTPLYFDFAKVGNYEQGEDVPFNAGEEDEKYVAVLPVTVNAYVHDISDWAGAFCGELYNDWDVCFDYNHKAQSGNSLGWTYTKVTQAFNDRDMRFAADPDAITDWSGAKELWVYVDAREMSEGAELRVAFEEDSVGRESFSLIDGKEIVLHRNGNDAYRAEKAIVRGGGYVPLPVGFAGMVRLPLNDQTFGRYWDEGGNAVLDIDRVVQFQLAIKSGAADVGKTIYLDDFAIVGDVAGETMDKNMYFGNNSADKDNVETAWKYVPVGYTYKKVWSLDKLAKRNGSGGAITAWYGEFVGKLLTGMAFGYKATADERLVAAAEEIITALAAAQGDDGYLGVFTGAGRFAIGESNWDLWNHYHCVTGLLEWYGITGSVMAKEVAVAALDCIYNTFKDRSYIVAGGYETNRAIMHGYTLGYKATGDEKYLAEALRILEKDCAQPNGWYRCGLENRDFAASDCTRWEVLHMMMALGDLYEITGKEEYYIVMSNLWESILKTDVHNSGGFTTNEGAIGDPYAEGIIETCCTIAWQAFTNEYYKYNKSVRVADELERTYLNALLGSLTDGDKYCTYNTPMDGIKGSSNLHGGVYDGRRVPSQQDISFQYNAASPDMNCCQANIARGIGQIAEWAAVSEGNALTLNYYGVSTIKTSVDGKNVTITQKTGYPIDGASEIEIGGLEKSTVFTLRLRIPGWAFGSSVEWDGKSQKAAAGEYFEIMKEWKNGDKIKLDLATSFTYWKGEGQQASLTSVYYGPILLALDKSYAPFYNQNTSFTVADIESGVVKSGAATGAMMFVDVKLGGETVRLVDFASAGKYNGEAQPATYWSWLKVTDAPTSAAGEIWQRTDKKKIMFDENVTADMLAYPGETVSFTVNLPEGKQIDKVTCGAVSEFEVRGDKVCFVMPNSDVNIGFMIKDADIPDNPDVSGDAENKPIVGLAWLWAVGGTVAAAVIAAIIVVIIKKKRR